MVQKQNTIRIPIIASRKSAERAKDSFLATSRSSAVLIKATLEICTPPGRGPNGRVQLLLCFLGAFSDASQSSTSQPAIEACREARKISATEGGKPLNSRERDVSRVKFKDRGGRMDPPFFKRDTIGSTPPNVNRHCIAAIRNYNSLFSSFLFYFFLNFFRFVLPLLSFCHPLLEYRTIS